MCVSEGDCLSFRMVLCVGCIDRTMLYLCIEYHIEVNMYHVSVHCIDEHMINVHFSSSSSSSSSYYYYYYYYYYGNNKVTQNSLSSARIFKQLKWTLSGQRKARRNGVVLLVLPCLVDLFDIQIFKWYFLYNNNNNKNKTATTPITTATTRTTKQQQQQI